MRDPARPPGATTDPFGRTVQVVSATHRRDQADRLYRRFGAIVYRRALVLLGSTDAAARATPAVFAHLLRRIERFDEPDALRWILEMTTRQCLAALRRASLDPAGRRRGSSGPSRT